MGLCMLLIWGALFLSSLKQIHLYRCVGLARYAKKRYHRLCFMISLLVYSCMLTQIILAYNAGANLLYTALPLHICGMMGLLTAPMLFSNIWMLQEFYVYIGVPGALLALCFPSVMRSEHQSLMDMAFYSLHALIVVAGVVSFYKYRYLRPRTAIVVFFLSVAFMVIVYAMNMLLNTNYMFLRAAPQNTPLEMFYNQGETFYLGSLMLIAALLLTLEAFIAYIWQRQRK